MKRIEAGISGTIETNQGTPWSDLGLSKDWLQVIDIFQPNTSARAVQNAALGKWRVLETRRNLIISSPTNSGKSLVGLLIMLDAVRHGGRAILLEPLRAIAREKYDELHSHTRNLSKALGINIQVWLSTGDYRLEDETLSAPPPTQGELIVATPERLEAILRNPEYTEWVQTIRCVCVDEAHLVSSPRRGATLEYLITVLLSLPAPPRIVFLSATLGELEKAQNWLAPCDAVRVTERHPPLHKEVIALEPDENANAVVSELARQIMSEQQTNLLVFVYQTRSAESLARQLQVDLGELTGPAGFSAYHARMTSANREQVRRSFIEGRQHCLITTTALGMGVNLPATHVIIRDTTFPGVGRLSVTDLMQMMGRAGRGEQPGHALAMVRTNDGWDPSELAQALSQEILPRLISTFEQTFSETTWSSGLIREGPIPAATLVASYLSRYHEQGQSSQQIKHFFEHSLGGQALVSQVEGALRWLTDTQHLLAWCDDDNIFRLTTLGLKTTQAVLPLKLASGFGQLMRDLMAVDPTDHLLNLWRPLDHLITLNLLYENMPTLRPFSHDLANLVDAWMEQNPMLTPLLYREWIAGESGFSHSDQVLGSLGILVNDIKNSRGEAARKMAYQAVFHAIVLYQRGLGKNINDLERQWKINGLEGVEERWRDDYLWLLNGISKILDLRSFYYCLRETCGATQERLSSVNKMIKKMSWQAVDLQEHLKYCSPLGPLLYSLKKQPDIHVGIGTIRRLEDAGILNLGEIAQLTTDDLVGLGVRRKIAEKLVAYIRRKYI